MLRFTKCSIGVLTFFGAALKMGSAKTVPNAPTRPS